MPRLRHKGNGVIVNVDDAMAESLGGAWESADKFEQKQRAAQQRADAKAAAEAEALAKAKADADARAAADADAAAKAAAEAENQGRHASTDAGD